MIHRGAISKFFSEELTSEEQAAVEENAVAMGMSRLQMMENAGSAVARFVLSKYDVRNKLLVVVAGLGNNGGDGFVAARHLVNSGARVDLILLGSPSEIRTEEARNNWSILASMSTNISLHFVNDSADLVKVEEVFDEASVIIDAILGTGVKGKLKEPIASVVRKINSAKVPVIAIDVPSGLDPDTGKALGDAVRAKYTVTFHKNKRGFKYGVENTGEVVVADIGIPFEAELMTGPGDVKLVVKPRSPFSHKWDYGMVLVIGGSEHYSGAPALAAMSALRTGAGLSVVAAPESVASIIRSYSPNIIVRPLKGKILSIDSVEELVEQLDRCDSVVLGPGLGVRKEVSETVLSVLEKLFQRDLPAVVDADALKCIVGHLDILREGKFVLTPHAGEFEKLTGKKVPERWFQRVELAAEFARTYGCTLLLKGHETVITEGVRLKVDCSGTAALATGGSGDVLSGIVGTFLAWGSDTFRSASAAAYVLGSAGRLAQADKGFHLVASDLIEKIPTVLMRFDVEGR